MPEEHWSELEPMLKIEASRQKRRPGAPMTLDGRFRRRRVCRCEMIDARALGRQLAAMAITGN